MAQKTRRVSHGVAASTLFSAITLLYGTPAYGGFYPGTIDPGGTGTVPGFTGNAVFNIDQGCLPEGTGWLATNANAGSGCGNASMYSATIDLYTLSPFDPPTPGTVKGNFVLGEPPGTWPIFGVYRLNGVLAGVDTDAMGPEPGTGFYASPPHNFWLQFVSGHCQFGCDAPGSTPDDPAYISMDMISNLSNPGTVIFGSACTDPNNCRVAAAPEPGTLGLLLGALGGGWLARRRKAKLKA